ESFITDSQAVHDTGPIAFDDNIRVSDETQKRLRRIFQIDDDALLPAINSVKICAHAVFEWKRKAPEIIAAQRIFDLNDAGSHLTQKMRGVPTRQQPGEIEHGQSHRFC